MRIVDSIIYSNNYIKYLFYSCCVTCSLVECEAGFHLFELSAEIYLEINSNLVKFFGGNVFQNLDETPRVAVLAVQWTQRHTDDPGQTDVALFKEIKTSKM